MGGVRRKIAIKYYFSVEGETEKWYLEWLASEIRKSDNAKCHADIRAVVQTDPVKMAKNIVIVDKTTITHVCDYESEEEVHVNFFKHTIDELVAAARLGKSITYNLGYSNYTFELWMILHKTDCNVALAHRRQYLDYINKAYCREFKNMGQYKRESHFKKLLGVLSIDDVKSAIRRSRAIMAANAETHGYTEQTYKKYKYYRENPSLSIWESVEKILNDCGL